MRSEKKKQTNKMAEIRRRKGDGDSSDLLNDEKEVIAAKDERKDSVTAESSDHVNIDFFYLPS